MNIAERMREVLPILNEGLDGKRFYLEAECEDSWNENYAIVKGLYYDPVDSEYFDHDQFKYDYECKVRGLFSNCQFRFYWQCGEIEVEKRL